MLTQEQLLNNILCLINDIQITKEMRDEILLDPSRAQILELRERIIVIMDELKSIYWHRESRIKDNYLPIPDDGCDVVLVKEAHSLFQKMCDINTEIGKEVEYGV